MTKRYEPALLKSLLWSVVSKPSHFHKQSQPQKLDFERKCIPFVTLHTICLLIIVSLLFYGVWSKSDLICPKSKNGIGALTRKSMVITRVLFFKIGSKPFAKNGLLFLSVVRDNDYLGITKSTLNKRSRSLRAASFCVQHSFKCIP